VLLAFASLLPRMAARDLKSARSGAPKQATANRNKSYDHSSCKPPQVSRLHLQQSVYRNQITTISLDMLCAWCQHIFQGYRKLNSRSPDNGDCFYTYKQHTASIQTAASNGCQIRAILCNHFERSEDHIPTELFDLSYRLSCPFRGDKAVCYLMLFYFAVGNKHCYISFVLCRTEGNSQSPSAHIEHTTGLIASQMLYLFFRTITSPCHQVLDLLQAGSRQQSG
jgi:hypothetical protein